MSDWQYTETELWRHGTEGVSLFHVFGLTVTKHAVLVFSEARNGDGSDAGCTHFIFMRRSLDCGIHFEPNVCLLPGECWTNPVPIYDESTGRVYLFVSDNHGNCRTENYLLYSDDDGETWSKKAQINVLLESNSDPLPFHLAGPGHGICLTRGEYAGRLIVPFWHRRRGTEVPLEMRGYCASLIYSDDHGKTWHATDSIGQVCMANESRVVETEENLLWVIRPCTTQPCRFESRNTDGGITWSEPRPQAMSAANNCDAGAIRVCGKGEWANTVLISRISEMERRWNTEILISTDGGETFPMRFALPSGDAMPGYSDLCVLEGDEPVIGLVHCRYNHVLFSRISMQALTGGKYENTQRTVWL